jgi:biotin transport system substrate-specific component
MADSTIISVLYLAEGGSYLYMPPTASIPSLRPQVLADSLPGARLRDAVLVVAYAVLVGLTAQIVIPLPFTPVPITGQTFGVLLGGMAIGWRRGILGMLLYTALGLAGLPWFAGGHGGLEIAGAPSFGYILGFVAAALTVGRLAEWGFDRNSASALAAMVIGNLVIYAFGVAWLVTDLHLSVAKGLALGVFPFLLGDAIKALIAACVLPGAWLLVGRAR